MNTEQLAVLIELKAELESKIEDVQTNIAFLELNFNKLNQALISQQQQLTDLEKKIELIINFIKSQVDINGGTTVYSIQEEKPPHY